MKQSEAKNLALVIACDILRAHVHAEALDTRLEFDFEVIDEGEQRQVYTEVLKLIDRWEKNVKPIDWGMNPGK